MKAEKVLYGQTVLYRKYCKKCKRKALIIDGRYQCCMRISHKPDELKLVREAEGEPRRTPIPAKIKKSVLEKQQNTCIYCGYRFNESFYMTKSSARIIFLKPHFDHFKSWNSTRDNRKQNIVAACQICNLLKSNKYFDTIEKAKEFLDARRTAKGLEIVY